MEGKKRKWTFKGIHSKLDKLEPAIRKRAQQIAGELMNTDGFTEERAIDEGIDLAEELYYDFEG